MFILDNCGGSFLVVDAGGRVKNRKVAEVRFKKHPESAQILAKKESVPPNRRTALARGSLILLFTISLVIIDPKQTKKEQE